MINSKIFEFSNFFKNERLPKVVMENSSVFPNVHSRSKNGAKFNYRWIAYSAGVKYGTPEDWNFAWRMYNTTQVASERNLWLRALASSNDPYILQQ